MYKKKAFLIAIFAIFTMTYSHGQYLNESRSICDSCSNQLFFRIESTSFLINNEYANHFTRGFTGLGFFFEPKFEYYLDDKTRIKAGIHLLKYSGRNNFSHTIPIFTVQHKLSKNIDLVFGNIYGNLTHQLEEPLYRFDHYYQNNIENGIQIIWKSKLFYSDIWLHWEKFILRNDPHQEQFIFGNNSQIQLYSNKKISFTLPFQWMIFHKGGQIYNTPVPILTIFNGATGIDFNYNIDSKSKLVFSPLILLYKGISLPEKGKNAQFFKNGNGLYLKLRYINPYFNAMLGFWKANKFIAPKGEYLFLSISEQEPLFSRKSRTLFVSKLAVNHQIKQYFNLELHFNGYFDPMNYDFSHSTRLMLMINQSFFLKKLK